MLNMLDSDSENASQLTFINLVTEAADIVYNKNFTVLKLEDQQSKLSTLIAPSFLMYFCINFIKMKSRAFTFLWSSYFDRIWQHSWFAIESCQQNIYFNQRVYQSILTFSSMLTRIFEQLSDSCFSSSDAR